MNNNYSEELFRALVAAAERGGGEVVIPAGRHVIGPEPIEADISNVHLRGEGKGTSILAIEEMPSTRRPLLLLHGNNWSVSDLTIDCADLYPDADRRYAALGGNGEGIAIHDIEIKRMGRVGIVVGSSSSFRIENCDISLTTPDSSLNSGIVIPKNVPTTGGIIKGNRLFNTIMQIAGRNHQLIGNICKVWKFGAAIFTTWGSSGMLIEGNDLSGGVGRDVNNTWCLGIECWSRDTIIAHNRCYDNDGSGLSTGAPHCAIVGNVCFNNRLNGIGARHEGLKENDWPQSAHHNVFLGNQSFNNGWYGYSEQHPGLVGIHHAANCYTPNTRGDMRIPT